jgi:hypothetical protein
MGQSENNLLQVIYFMLLNDLCDSLHPILDAAKALYRGVDDVKLKDYTVLQLKKRINAEGKREVKKDVLLTD